MIAERPTRWASPSPRWARIYIAGSVINAENVCQHYCSDVGLCVTVTPTTYVYKYGKETGVIVEIINYPRFPSEQSEITRHATVLGSQLMYGLAQGSYTVMDPETTSWYSRRDEDNK